jgi:hypothetical protein
MKRRCPICGKLLNVPKSDWHLKERKIEDHSVAWIGTAENAADHIRSVAKHQIAANLAAYELDYDAEIGMGFLGTAYVQCPEKRKQVGVVCVPI